MKILAVLTAALLLGQVDMQAIACEQTYSDPMAFIKEGTGLDLTRCKHKKKKGRYNRSLGHIYNYNEFDAITEITAGSAFTFNGTAVRSGAIHQISDDTFAIRKSGHYYVNFIADALYPTTNMGVILELNGKLLPPGTPTNFIDTPHILQQIIVVEVSDCHPKATLRVIATSAVQGASFSFPSGPAVSLSIIELQTDGK